MNAIQVSTLLLQILVRDIGIERKKKKRKHYRPSNINVTGVRTCPDRSMIYMNHKVSREKYYYLFVKGPLVVHNIYILIIVKTVMVFKLMNGII